MKLIFHMFVKTNFQLCVLLVVCLWLCFALTSSCVSYMVNLSDLARLEAAVDIHSQVDTILYLRAVCLSFSLHGPFILSFLLKFIL